MKTNKGFTLIELLIVIAIIGILSAALLPTIMSAPARGRDAARQANLSALATAIEAVNLDAGSYPANTAPGTGECLNPAADVLGIKDYLAGGQIPGDPSGSRDLGTLADPGNCVAAGHYYYLYIGNSPANYVLVTAMELESNNNFTGDPTALAGPPTLADDGDYYVLAQ